ncbi:1,2-phenylacetyl-CoA epoxidase subunit PaaC [Auritidibacter ignavus]|uniref:1,2-phenylacetyl-CoA epoxidase subunit PaaC n=1 Tax=Auritidibacter ignavus TaxID=678932 RepID=UPI001CB71333|nr:1,2-phenylacetyl-CoA epoxidase subunit PaaC [Auritidibacter ignavus]
MTPEATDSTAPGQDALIEKSDQQDGSDKAFASAALASTPATHGMPTVGNELSVAPLLPGAGVPLTATITTVPSVDVAGYALVLGDDALVAAQRLGELVTNGPELEEDIALTNIALDQLGAARMFLQYAGRGLRKTEDELAYFRDESEFRSCALVEQPNGDFAQTIAKILLTSLYQQLLYRQLRDSSDEFLAAVASKSLKEVDYHVEHATMWVTRLGDGTQESHRRMQAGFDMLWSYIEEIFDDSAWTELIDEGVAVRMAGLRREYFSRLEEIITNATLTIPEVVSARGRGRFGLHSPHLGHILAQMQVLARQHPGATW